MMNSLMRRVDAIERRRSTASSPAMISALEVSAAKAELRRKLGLPARNDDLVPAPVSRRSVEKARDGALQKLRSFLDRHR
jgi:hypothetical protein